MTVFTVNEFEDIWVNMELSITAYLNIGAGTSNKAIREDVLFMPSILLKYGGRRKLLGRILARRAPLSSE